MSQDALISAVMDRPALWQSKHPNYKNKNVNSKLWGEIKQLFPGNEVSELKKRWKNLKDSYRKELKKVPTSRSGDPGSSEHDHQWKYFEIMSFVRDEILPTSTDSNLVDASNAEDEGEVSTAVDVDSVESPQDDQSSASIQSPISSENNVDRPSRKRQTPNELRAEYLEIEKRKLRILESEISKKDLSSDSGKSDDYHFLMSILPVMEKLAPIQKMRVRNKINQALMEEMNMSMYGESFGRYGYNNQPMKH